MTTKPAEFAAVNIRWPSELHRKVKLAAALNNESMAAYIQRIIRRELDETPEIQTMRAEGVI